MTDVVGVSAAATRTVCEARVGGGVWAARWRRMTTVSQAMRLQAVSQQQIGASKVRQSWRNGDSGCT